MIVIRQTGQGILIFEPLYTLFAFGEQEPQAAELPHYERRKSDQADCDQRHERKQPVNHRSRRTVWLPAEPPDDAPITAEHRLNRAFSRRGFGLEPQVFETRRLLEGRNKFRIRLGPAGRLCQEQRDRSDE